ncbi:MAG: Dabb family protein [Chitinophagaceae bacterium]
MQKKSRREFIGNTGKAAVATGLVTFADTNTTAMSLSDKFIHHVYFWLKNPDSKEDKQKLVEGLRKLSKVKTIKEFHIGQPADTNRDVIDRSYAVSWCLLFDNATDQASYQVDPVHLKFVEECSSLWTKVVVYDSVSVS